ncbi:2'-5' RNA ligase family protein [Streptomyces sp. NPDC015131]|uniref:2'-5' RNA ligase family protein n=1 Tax=Streptomyces sp. NPDC015131 TaxID=3364941 RepID=UPI0036FBD516
MLSVELLPDEATERAVREVWARLRRAGLVSLAAHRHPTNRPHLTLAAAAEPAPGARAGLAEALRVLPVPLVLDGTVRFGGRANVLAWAVRRDEPLLRLQGAVWRALRDASGCAPPNPLHDPVRWCPHLTLGRGRGAVWPLTDGELFGAAGGVFAGRWVAARTYDSVTRTTAAV